MEKLKILITGGSGFIGNHLVKKFLKNDYDVTIFDLNPPNNSEANFIQGSIFDLDSVSKVVEDNDVIVHMIGLADAGAAQSNPMKSFDLNIKSLQNVLASMDSSKKIIFPSSAAVYGVTEDLPIKENFNLTPTNIYSWHKMICEKMIKAHQKNFGMQYVILRLFNVYGGGNKGIINSFIEKSRNGEIIEVFGSYQYRDFIYAGDVADAIYQSVVYEKAVNRFINIGSGKGIQIRELLNLLSEILSNAKWNEVKSDFEGYDSIADITSAKILLDFNPDDSIEFMKKIIKEEML